MGRTLKRTFMAILLTLAMAASGVVAQQDNVTPQGDVTRVRLGLELYDAIHQGLFLRLSVRPKRAERIEFGANMGYSLWRSYRYMAHLQDQVHGWYASTGVQWRLAKGGTGAWLLGAYATIGVFQHRATATIPNYYGDVVQHFQFRTGYLGLQFLAARSYEWRRWRLDAGLRLSYCNLGYYPEIVFHVYQPGIGRANMWSKRYNNGPSILAYPFLALSFRLR